MVETQMDRDFWSEETPPPESDSTPFVVRATPPLREEQREAYRTVAGKVCPEGPGTTTSARLRRVHQGLTNTPYGRRVLDQVAETPGFADKVATHLGDVLESHGSGDVSSDVGGDLRQVLSYAQKDL